MSSVSFGTQGPAIPHLSTGEVADLRRDVEAGFVEIEASRIPLAVDDWSNAVAPDAAGLLIATATTVAPQTVLTAGLLAPGKAALLAYPRNVTFTTAGGTPAHAPATAVITGTDINDEALEETVTLAQTATIAEGAYAFKTITSIVYAAADGTGATVAIGFGKKLGFSKPIVRRGGACGVVQEIANGVVVATGTFANATVGVPNGTYSPSADPDGSKDYAVYYEFSHT